MGVLKILQLHFCFNLRSYQYTNYVSGNFYLVRLTKLLIYADPRTEVTKSPVSIYSTVSLMTKIQTTLHRTSDKPKETRRKAVWKLKKWAPSFCTEISIKILQSKILLLKCLVRALACLLSLLKSLKLCTLKRPPVSHLIY